MAAHDTFERRGQSADLDADHQTRADPGTQNVEGGPRHGRRGFAGRDQADGAGTWSESSRGEPPSVNRSEAGPENGQEIGSQIGESVCQ